MARSRVIVGACYVPDPRSGRPIANGSMYIGDVNTDPTVLANRKDVYLIQQDGSTVTIPAASQPLRTSAGGVVSYNGSPVQVETDDAYSIAIYDGADYLTGTQVYYFPEVVDALSIDAPFLQSANFYPNDVSSVSNAYVVVPPIAALPDALLDGQIIVWRPSANSSTNSTLSVMLSGGPTMPKPNFLPDGVNQAPADYYKTSRDYMSRWSVAADGYIDIDEGLFSYNPSIQVWNQYVDYYKVPSYVTGSDTFLYRSISQTGPNLGGAFDPVSDAGVHWTRIYENTVAPSLTGGNAGHLYGLEMSNNVGTPATVLDFAVGSARDSTNVLDMTIATPWTKSIAAVWAAGTGNGGFPSTLSAGSPVNDTWYSVWEIAKADGTVDFGWDSMANGIANTPTLLQADATDYTLFRRIGWNYYGTATIRKFFQDGDDIAWDVIQADFSTVAASTTGLAVTVSAAPLTKARMSISNSATAGTTYFLVTETDQTNTTPTNNLYNIFATSGQFSGMSEIERKVDATSQVRQRISAAGSYTINTIGFSDSRGK